MRWPGRPKNSWRGLHLFFHLNTPVNELWVYNVRLRCTCTCFTCAIVNANVEANGLMLWCVYCTVSPSLYDVSTTMPSMCTQTMDENTVGRRIIHFIHTVNALDMNVSQFMLFTMLPKTRIFFFFFYHWIRVESHINERNDVKYECAMTRQFLSHFALSGWDPSHQ